LQKKQNEFFTSILMVLGVILLLLTNCSDRTENKSNNQAASGQSQMDVKSKQIAKLPMLVDLGKGTCIPCKKMKPILEELEKEYKGKAIVKVIDLRYEPKESDKYKIRLIPTQIFFDAEGKEVFRHEGFMDKQSIKAKFAEMGVY
jgi:thioredoxin 1